MEGKTAVLVAFEEAKYDIFLYLIETFDVDLWARDTYTGNTVLHLAVKAQNFDLTRQLFDMDPSKCLEMNYEGKTPFQLAVCNQDMETLELFDAYKL